MRDDEPMSKLTKEETNRQNTVHNKSQLRKLRQYYCINTYKLDGYTLQKLLCQRWR